MLCGTHILMERISEVLQFSLRLPKLTIHG